MNNKKHWKPLRYVLSSASKGSTELFKIFKWNRKATNIQNPPVPLHNPNNSKSPKRIPSNPAIFTDLQLEKKTTGNYETFKKNLYFNSRIVLIFGKRGSGKSALGLRILENIMAKTTRRCHVLVIDERLIPSWIEPINNIQEAKSSSAILIDEGAITFNARESMKGANKELSKIMAIARHRNLTIIFITQNTGMIDKNILKLSDSLMIKEGSLLQLEMERPEIKKFYAKSKELIDKAHDNKIKYIYVVDSEFEGLLKHTLPSFWTDQLSKNRSSP